MSARPEVLARLDALLLRFQAQERIENLHADCHTYEELWAAYMEGYQERQQELEAEERGRWFWIRRIRQIQFSIEVNPYRPYRP